MRDSITIKNFPPKNKAIALIDILGFSDYLLKDKIALQTIVDKLVNYFYTCSTYFPKWIINHDYNEYAQKGVELKTIYISDSILLYLDFKNNKNISSSQEIDSLSYAVSFMTSLCLNYALPIRGAISYGECIISEADNIFIGKPIAEAHKFEKLQDWAGVILTHTEEYELEKENENGRLVKQVEQVKKIFCKNRFKTEKKEFIAINWTISEARYPKSEKKDYANKISEITGWPVLYGKSRQEVSQLVSTYKLSDKKNNIKFRNTFNFWEKYCPQEFVLQSLKGK